MIEEKKNKEKFLSIIIKFESKSKRKKKWIKIILKGNS